MDILSGKLPKLSTRVYIHLTHTASLIILSILVPTPPTSPPRIDHVY
jgi:hypothetical protein